MKRVLSILLNSILAAVFIGAVLLLIAPRVGLPQMVEVKIVRSGSMEPAIKTGGIVLIRPAPSYQVGEVITFGADTRTSVPTTHRIVSMRTEGGTTYYSTKGDANEDPDPFETPANKVIGKVLFTLPYMGYLLAFAKQPLGFALLVAIPAALIICNELLSIFAEVRRRRARVLEERAFKRELERRDPV